MNRSAKGSRYESRSKEWLEAQGYTCVRSAGSKGAFDLVAFREDGILLVQVKFGRWASPEERAVMTSVPIPPVARCVLHRWRTGARVPDVRHL